MTQERELGSVSRERARVLFLNSMALVKKAPLTFVGADTMGIAVKALMARAWFDILTSDSGRPLTPARADSIVLVVEAPSSVPMTLYGG